MKKQHQLCNLPKVSDFKVALKNLTPREADIGEKAQIYLQKSYNWFPKSFYNFNTKTREVQRKFQFHLKIHIKK